MMARCDARFDAMIQDNVLEEVARLRDLELGSDLPVMRVLGLRPLIGHIERRLPLDAAISQAKTETRQFAKRQVTWLKRHMISWKSFSTQDSKRNLGQIIALIDF